MYTKPTIADFKAYFVRDFNYGITTSQVMDADIAKAMGQADFNFNESLFVSQSNFTIGYLFLTAHWLCMDFRFASQGIKGQFTWLEQSKTVGSVSESFGIPQRILDNPEMAALSKTNYGAKYLQLILPSLSGQIFIVCGRTQP